MCRGCWVFADGGEGLRQCTTAALQAPLHGAGQPETFVLSCRRGNDAACQIARASTQALACPIPKPYPLPQLPLSLEPCQATRY